MSAYCPQTGQPCGRLDCDPPYDCVLAETLHEHGQPSSMHPPLHPVVILLLLAPFVVWLAIWVLS